MITLVRTSAALGYSPAGLAHDGRFLYVADGAVVRKYDPDFTLVRTSGAVATTANGLTFDDSESDLAANDFIFMWIER